MPTKLILYILLLATGAAWGLSNPLMKIAVSTGYQPFGLIFWQLVVIVVTAGAVALWRNGRLPPLRRYFWHFAIVALLGTLLPDTLIYIAAAHVSAGVLSLLLAQVTMFALPMALLRARELLMDRFRPLLLENGVTEQQWRVLRVLDERGMMDPKDLAQAACLLNPSLTRIMQLLEKKALIARASE